MINKIENEIIPKTVWNIDDLLVLNGIKKLQQIAVFIAQEYKSIAELFSGPSKHPMIKKFLSLGQKVIREELQKGIEYADHQRKNLSKKYSVVSYFDSKYPRLLRSINYPVLLLFYSGTLPEQEEYSRSISIVGTRSATQYGKLQTERYIHSLSQNGFIFCSGTASGIDSTVHKFCLQTKANSYAFVASGLDKITPEVTKSLCKKIIENGGAILSELPFGEPSFTYNFIKRNRLLSGFSHSTLVIESPEKGGSLITARISFEQNRPVYAIPGNVSTSTSQGVNLLIKNCRAMMTISPDDILEDLGFLKKDHTLTKKDPMFESKEEEKIYSVLTYEPMHIDEISDVADISQSILFGALLSMEFSGFIRQVPGNMYLRT